MSGVNTGRVVLGGIVAGIVINVLEFAGSLIYGEQSMAAFEAHNLTSDSPVSMAIFLLLGFIVGIAAVWIYAAIRPRYGPGPGTAVRAGLVSWVLCFGVAMLAYRAMGLFPPSVLLPWALVSFAETLLGTQAGAWLYREA